MVALATTLLLLAFQGQGPLEQLEHRLLDQRFQARQELPVDPRIAIVAVDEASYKNIQEHSVFWLPLYARVIESALDAGAVAVGLDIIPTYSTEELFAPFGMVALEHPGQIVLAGFLDPGEDKLVLPPAQMVALTGVENVGLVNTTPDSDGVVRRVRVQPLPHQELGRETWSFFAPRLAELVTGEERPEESLLINFAPPGSFPIFSFHEVLQADPSSLARWFRGKVVLLGMTAKADQDLLQTPFYTSHGLLPGVEVHANALNTLLAEQGLRAAPGWVLPLLTLAAALTGATAGRWLSPGTSLLTGAVAVGLLLSGGASAFQNGSLVLPLALPVLAVPLSLGLAWAHRYLTEEREKQRVRSVFGRYVSRDVMEEMLNFPEDYEVAEKRRITVMYSDINGFSTACETMEPEKVVRLLNEYFTEMTSILFRHRGTVIRFVGDEFLVLFGAPRRLEEQEKAAVLAGLDMVDRLKEMEKEKPEGFHSVKVGIHSGEMILASIGSEERSDYNVVGDNANMGARVLSLTKPLGAEILISEDVYERVKDLPGVEFIDHGLHQVKGRRGEVRVYEVRRP